MKVPKVSIIMPIYDAEKYLKQSIDSILNQSFQNFEFIIINDGSQDNSVKIIKKYMKEDKRIKFIDNKKNIGLPKSLNKGLELAKGKYIARMDGDDICKKNRFKTQINFLDNHPEIFLIGTSAIIIDEKGKRLGILRKFNNPKKIKNKLIKSNPIIHPSTMFRNTKKIFYREKFKSSEDYDFYLRILSLGKKITNIPEFLIEYRISKDSFVSKTDNQYFYFQKAKEFYLQRKMKGFDEYKKLNPPPENRKPIEFEKSNLTSKIFIELQDNNSIKTREDIKTYLHKYGFDRKMLIYYLLSFIPKKIFVFIQKII